MKISVNISEETLILCTEKIIRLFVKYSLLPAV